LYGGGGGGGAIANHGAAGANGAVRIIWSLRQLNRQYPTLNTKTITANEPIGLSTIAGASGSYSTLWRTSLRHRVSLEFASVTDIRNFFKLGGSVITSVGAIGSPANSKTSDWYNFLRTSGTASYTASSFRRGGNVVVRSKTFVSGSYSDNYIQVWGELVNDTTVIITTIFDDASIDPLYDDFVSGISVSSAVNYSRPASGITGPAPTVSTIYGLAP
jgi:hypothetical protein